MKSKGKDKTFLLYNCKHCEAPMFRSQTSIVRSGFKFKNHVIPLQGHDVRLVETVDVNICGQCGRINPTKEVLRIANWKRVEYREIK